MKIIVRIAVGFVVLLVAGFVGLAVMLPRIAASDAVRQQVTTAARSALGRDVRYADLDFGLFPPSLMVVEPVVSGAHPDDEDFLEARRVALRVDLAPLLARAIVIDSLVVEGAIVRLVRTADGFELPQPSPDPEAAPSEAPETESDGGEEEGGFVLAARSLELTDATVFVEDRSVSPTVTWELRDVDLSAEGSLDEPVDLAASLALASGGTLGAKGSASLAGELDLAIELDAVDVTPLQSYLDTITTLAGTITGSLDLAGAASNPSTVADLKLAGARFALDDIRIDGDVSVRADLEDLLAAPKGSFDIDASGAELVYGGAFTKPPGTKATLKGRVVTREDGVLGVDDVKLSIRNLEGEARATGGPKPSFEITTEPFELAGWEDLVPALAASPLAGRARANGLVVTAAPLGLRGGIELDDVVVSVPDTAPVTVRGTLSGRGNGIETEGFEAVIGGQVATIDAVVSDLFGSPRYRVKLGAEKADSNELATALAGKRDFLIGPLTVTGDLRGSVTAERSPLETASGDLDFGIDEGRLVGVSLLELTLTQMGGAPGVAASAGRAFGGRDLEPFYEDAFESLRGDLQVADGLLREDLDLVYAGYGAKLRGTVGLRDFSIDMSGELVIYETLDRVIALSIGAARDYEPRRRTIQLAAVRGTLYDPEVQLARNTASDFVGNYARDLAEDAVRDSLGRDGQRIYDILRGGGKDKL